MIKALNEIEVISLFIEDLPSATAFYKNVFGLEVVYQDDVSIVMKLGHLMINLLQVTEAHELVEPAAVAGAGLGSRCLLTIKVVDADAVCAELEQHGVNCLTGRWTGRGNDEQLHLRIPPEMSGKSRRT